MKINPLAMALAMALTAGAMPAAAATVEYNALIDLDPSMYEADSVLVVRLPGAPIAISVGDTLTGTIKFANQGRITIFNDPEMFDWEQLSGHFRPDNGAAYSVSDFTFLGVRGDYLGPEVVTSAKYTGALGFGKLMNFTDTGFSFTGISFNITFTPGHYGEDYPLTTSVTPNTFVVVQNSAISEGAAIPEPATWAMMIIGFGAVGAAARRRRPAFETAS